MMRALSCLATSVVLALVSLSLCYGQALRDDAKSPGVAAETTSNITNIFVVDPDLIKQAQTLAEVRKLPASQDPVVVPWLTAHAGELQPAFTYELSQRLVDSDRQDEGF